MRVTQCRPVRFSTPRAERPSPKLRFVEKSAVFQGLPVRRQTAPPFLSRLYQQPTEDRVENHKNYFHLHLISDSTGETLIAAGPGRRRPVPGLAGARARLSARSQSQAACAGARCDRCGARDRALHDRRPGAFRRHRPALPGDGVALRFRARADPRRLPVLSRSDVASARRRPARDGRRVFRPDRSARTSRWITTTGSCPPIWRRPM